MFFLGWAMRCATEYGYTMIRFEYKTSRYKLKYVIPIMVYVGIIVLFLIIPGIKYFIHTDDYIVKAAMIFGILLPELLKAVKKSSSLIS